MKNRRSFLKNSALGAIALGASSKLSGTSKVSSTEDTMMCDPTTLDFYGEGPFYTDAPPLMVDNMLTPETEPGTKLVISGRVLNLDCAQFIPNTIVDVWHANDAGEYDNQGYNFRGYVVTNDQGFYLFETILPGKYLNGSSFRPAHIHFKITPPGFETLTTQLYFEGDTSIAGDAAASITTGTYDASHRIIALTEDDDGSLMGTFDIIINGEGTSVSTKDLHLDRGMIYELNPNPVHDRVEIKYGVFKKSKVGLIVYDMQGRQVAVLEDQELVADKYTSIWIPESALAAGHYFVALKINDLQVHYLPMIKK